MFLSHFLHLLTRFDYVLTLTIGLSEHFLLIHERVRNNLLLNLLVIPLSFIQLTHNLLLVHFLIPPRLSHLLLYTLHGQPHTLPMRIYLIGRTWAHQHTIIEQVVSITNYILPGVYRRQCIVILVLLWVILSPALQPFSDGLVIFV